MEYDNDGGSEAAACVTAPDVEMSMLCDQITQTCKKFKTFSDKLQHLSSSSSKQEEEQGVSLFNVKADTMFTYMSNFLYLMLKKCNGESISDPLTRERIGQCRVILEKTKPLELKLKYQIDKYMKMANSEHIGSGDGGGVLDKSNFHAKIENLQDNENDNNDVSSNEDEDEENEGDDGHEEEKEKGGKPWKKSDDKSKAVYKPPKLAAVPYDDSNEEEKRKKKLEHSKKRALSTTIIQELKEEYLDTPLEITNSTTLRNKRTNYRQEKESYEETYFTRLPTTKKERHRDKLMSALTLGTLGSEVTRFEDISALDERATDRSSKRKNQTTKNKSKKFKKRRTR